MKAPHTETHTELTGARIVRDETARSRDAEMARNGAHTEGGSCY